MQKLETNDNEMWSHQIDSKTSLRWQLKEYTFYTIYVCFLTCKALWANFYLWSFTLEIEVQFCSNRIPPEALYWNVIFLLKINTT
jgi:hypothetical protein